MDGFLRAWSVPLAGVVSMEHGEVTRKFTDALGQIYILHTSEIQGMYCTDGH